MVKHEQVEWIDCVDIAAFEEWLAAHHGERDEVWLRIAKKASGRASVNAWEGTEAALCFGWIDGLRRSLDDDCFLQRYSPRRRRSPWSRINADRALELIEAGRMRPAGFAEIERARADGRWQAAYSQPRPAATGAGAGA